MTKKNKPFDCVDMKHSIQENILRDYEARKGEFSSYVEYLRASISESDWASRQLARRSKKSA